MGILVLVRHGESRWNASKKFTGWVDVPLSEKGLKQAIKCAENLKKLSFDVAFTSNLERARTTLNIILSKQEKVGIYVHNNSLEEKRSEHLKRLKMETPVFTSQAINERFYGKLQGMNKDAARKKWGAEQVFLWRRSWDVQPPGGESLKDTYNRTIPYFKKKIMSQVKKGKKVIVSAHGNSLRSIIKYIENISINDIPKLNLKMGWPYNYKYSKGKLVPQQKITFTQIKHY